MTSTAMEIAAFDDDEYENMSYDERRNFNLARNREMMALLFSADSSSADNAAGVQEENKSSVIADIMPNEPDADDSLEGIIHNKIFCRDKEVLRLLQFLDCRLFPSQPMLIYGPAASGKSLLCTAAVTRITSSACMSISCTAETSVKKFMQGLWLDALASISKFNKAQLNITSSFEDDSKIKAISTFSDLVDRLSSLLYCQAHILKKLNTTKVPGLIILIDRIDEADGVEEGLARRLLSLDELCHPMIKVLAVGRCLPRAMTVTCLLLQLLPYTDAQLVSILCEKYQSECEANPSRSTSVDSAASSTSVLADFRALCEQALPQFTMTTRRVDEIWTMMQELYERRNPSKNSHTLSSTCSSTSESVAGSGSNVSKRPLDEDIRSLTAYPAVHMNTMTGAGGQHSLPVDMNSFFGLHWYSHLPLKTKALALAAFLASRNPASSDRTTFGQATKGRRKKTKTDQSEAGAGSKTSGSLPQCFGLERLLGIFHQIMPSISASTSNLPSNKYRKIRNFSSAGEVDKRVSIFSVDLRKQKHLNTKNEALLYSAINTLVKKRFLIVHSVSSAGTKAVKMSDSNNHLLYLCTLPMQRAEEIAQSIEFPLRDYLSY
mmetsp:Transcript_15708/g.26183  ORF Transcript_15708/g.26183 Transcript_15708/m.26183 type:complete len:606 (+) Transcript_15708:168-1985(+)|eukprot:CAMPEP_0114412598 /NCGR_PEP_ID=MMETSP0103-20121206/412_1 /TAXON_ID=37642 ORGANISM="Paraphysomonas imperforata, Strain PA2" /NCGR_SAMPLE_ID=MMETSP0103 /ASSEMBLY_ACC=CAM_ASM_000201 /LENGTH=605 /DNA_ID=CAMNT_0001580627 /DNA_START=103 /DNA_END=1920 /DNA_ORIENTATION=-